MQKSLWQPLKEELEQWQDAGLSPQFWWRDDDAARPGPIVQKLADIAHNLPVCLAIVPDWLQEGMAPWINENFDHASILQHGWAHVSHAAAGQKKSEFSDNRSVADCLNDIAKGHERLKLTFKDRYQPIFVPPWNRISENVIKHLSSSHLALSLYGASKGQERGIKRLNTHVDIINWRKGRGFIGTSEAITLCINHLQAKRLKNSAINPTEPTGILTHHLDHDAGCWQFLQELTDFSHQNQALKWVTPKEVLS